MIKNNTIKVSMPAISVAMFLLVASTGTSADEPAHAVEEVETVNVVQLIDIEPGEPVEESSSLIQIIGRMHAAAVHMPIGFLMLLVLLELLAMTKYGEGIHNALLFVAVITTLSFMPAVITGLLRASELESANAIPEHLATHRNLMIAGAVLVLTATAIRLKKRKTLSGAIKIVYLIALVGALLAVSIAGHLGGEMVYGEAFLPF